MAKLEKIDSETLDDNSRIVIDVDGDALENECDMLCHQVNLAGVMGGGIALSIAQKFPTVEKEYANYSSKRLGDVCFSKTDKYVVANCFSQTEAYNTDYEALKMCLDKVVNYLEDNNLHSVAIPYKYGCGIANGDWNTVRSIFIEKLKGYKLVIYKLKNTKKEVYHKRRENKDPILMLYEALSYLHKKGYEKLRMMSYYSPSGCYFRSVISVVNNFDITTGFVCMEDAKYPNYYYSTGNGFNFFENEESFKYKTVEELANMLLKKYPELEKQGKGTDTEYSSWYEKIVEMCRNGKYPYAFADYGYDIYSAGKIKLTNGEWIEYAPHGSYEE